MYYETIVSRIKSIDEKIKNNPSVFIKEHYKNYVLKKNLVSILFIEYDDGGTSKVYYYIKRGDREGFYVFDWQKGGFVEDFGNKKEELLAKEMALFYTESNYAPLKTDFAIFSFVEARINKFSKLKKEFIDGKKINDYFKIKSFENFNARIDDYAGRFPKEKREDAKKAILNRVNYFEKKYNYKLFKKVFVEYVQNNASVVSFSTKIEKIMDEAKKIIKEYCTITDKKGKKKVNEKATQEIFEETGIVFTKKEITFKEEVEIFNNFFFKVNKNCELENKMIKIQVKTWDDVSDKKPLVSKVRKIYMEEKFAFPFYYIQREKNDTKSLKEEIKEHFNKCVDSSYYKIKFSGKGILSYEVITGCETEFKPHLKIYDFQNNGFKEIGNYYQLLNEIDKSFKESKKDIMKGVGDGDDLKDKIFATKREVKETVKRIFKVIDNVKDSLIDKKLRKMSSTGLNKAAKNICEFLPFLIAVKEYVELIKLNEKGESMKDKVTLDNGFREKVKNFAVAVYLGEIPKEVDKKIISYIAGNLLRYFFEQKKKDELLLGDFIPVYSNIRNFKDLKEEIIKAVSMYGHEEKTYGNALKLLNFIMTGIDEKDQKELVDKEYFLAGMVESRKPSVIYITNQKDKGDNNE
jgi:hypothetical protein